MPMADTELLLDRLRRRTRLHPQLLDDVERAVRDGRPRPSMLDVLGQDTAAIARFVGEQRDALTARRGISRHGAHDGEERRLGALR